MLDIENDLLDFATKQLLDLRIKNGKDGICNSCQKNCILNPHMHTPWLFEN